MPTYFKDPNPKHGAAPSGDPRHAADVRAAVGARLVRQRDSNWAERVSEPGRVYDALTRVGQVNGQPIHDTGYSRRVTLQSNLPSIVWDKARGKWRRPRPEEFTALPKAASKKYAKARGQVGNRQGQGS